MAIRYTTQNHTYDVTLSGKSETILARLGPHIGSPYRILGGHDADSKLRIVSNPDGTARFLDASLRDVPYDRLSLFLEHPIKKGQQILARLISRDGELSPEGSDQTHSDIMLTSPVRDLV